MSIQQHNPMHPGAFIKRVYLEPNGIGSNELALKLSKVLCRSPESWMLMQDYYDLWQARAVVDLEQFEALKFA